MDVSFEKPKHNLAFLIWDSIQRTLNWKKRRMIFSFCFDKMNNLLWKIFSRNRRQLSKENNSSDVALQSLFHFISNFSQIMILLIASTGLVDLIQFDAKNIFEHSRFFRRKILKKRDIAEEITRINFTALLNINM